MATGQWLQTIWTEPRTIAVAMPVTEVFVAPPEFQKIVASAMPVLEVQPPPITFYTWREVLGL